jgi:hypothetical protein
MSFNARHLGTLPFLAATFVVASSGCGRNGGEEIVGQAGGSAGTSATSYLVTIQATSLAALGACPQAGAVALVTTTTNGGTTYTLERCGADGGTWTAIPCNTGMASSVAYVPGPPASLFACVNLAWTPVPIPPGDAGPQGPEGAQGPQGVQGVAGPAGPAGPQGDAGPPGPQGPAGMDGVSGEAGATGATGPQGAPGVSPQVTETTLDAGDPNCPNGGIQIVVYTPNGDSGLGTTQTGYACNGAQGEAGPAGPTGPQGAAGSASLGSGPCQLDTDCNDANPCTNDFCSSGRCEHSFAKAGTVCRPPVGPCDVAEACTGASPTCPADQYAAAGAICADGHLCESGNMCTGMSTDCPPVQPLPAGTACGCGGTCDGVDLTCQNEPAICTSYNTGSNHP